MLAGRLLDSDGGIQNPAAPTLFQQEPVARQITITTLWRVRLAASSHQALKELLLHSLRLQHFMVFPTVEQVLFSYCWNRWFWQCMPCNTKNCGTKWINHCERCPALHDDVEMTFMTGLPGLASLQSSRHNFTHCVLFANYRSFKQQQAQASLIFWPVEASQQLQCLHTDIAWSDAVWEGPLVQSSSSWSSLNQVYSVLLGRDKRPQSAWTTNNYKDHLGRKRRIHRYCNQDIKFRPYRD